MNKVNPLFLDSTKPIGDKVVTNVELTHILLFDGESLFIEVKDSSANTQKFELREVPTKKSAKFKAEVWLKSESQIQYRFVVESEGKRRFASAFEGTSAGQPITEKWQPCFEPDPAPTRKPVRGTKSKSTFQPQLFDQLKFLMDDLL